LNSVKEQYIVDEHGERIAVILPLEEYEKIREDLHDLAIAAERREDPILPFEELKKRYMK
jgi:PHD/YefM family antitoxin component YafN of YafNO toxin-antitoxin module